MIIVNFYSKSLAFNDYQVCFPAEVVAAKLLCCELYLVWYLFARATFYQVEYFYSLDDFFGNTNTI